jgi:hypothetical protein
MARQSSTPQAINSRKSARGVMRRTNGQYAFTTAFGSTPSAPNLGSALKVAKGAVPTDAVSTPWGT